MYKSGQGNGGYKYNMSACDWLEKKAGDMS
jgi:hypothetical protein